MTDSVVIRIVVGALAVITLGGLAGMTWLISVGAKAELIVLISGPTTTSLGALAAVLVSTRSNGVVNG